MGFQGKASDVKTVSNSKALKSGLAEVKVISINPTGAEMKEVLGFEPKQEPVYVTDRENFDKVSVKNARIDFWLELEDGTQTKLSLYLSGEHATSKAGNNQYINAYGKTTWASDENNTSEWFLDEGVRQSYRGEEDLHKFMAAWLNVPYTKDEKGTCQIENPAAIFAGDFSELKETLEIFPDSKVRVLLGVKETDEGKQFQVVYTKKFDKVCVAPNYGAWSKELNSPYGAFKAELQDPTDLSLTDYTKVNPLEGGETKVEATEDDLF